MKGELEPMHSPEPVVVKGEGRYLSNIKLVAIVVVVIVLLVVVLILAILLGIANIAKKEETKAHVDGPTSQPAPTTPGTEVWWNYRLPRDVIPNHYNVFLNMTVDQAWYNGHVQMYVNVTRPTDIILVHSWRMNTSHVTVQNVKKQEDFPVKSKFSFNKYDYLVIEMEAALQPGYYLIRMQFVALFGVDRRGLYRSNYEQPNGDRVNFTATQFEPINARRAFPCFDEPELKATFNITIAHRPDYVALSNMPVYKSELIDGQKHEHYEKTVVMSTYLVAFVVGDFQYKEVFTERGVKMRVFARPSVVSQTAHAATVGSKMVTFFEKYFAVEYSLPKADMIGLPSFGPGAMENWGLITYRERYLLWEPGESTERSKESVSATVGHELAHQWFGNLVTMKWWDDIWLNEGFAKYFQDVAKAAIHPTWTADDLYILSVVNSAILADGLASSHPVKLDITRPSTIYQVFDTISYRKGAALLRMMKLFLGNETFHNGLIRYLKKHAFANADSDDLWRALRDESCARGSCVDVKHVMDTWTLQMGFPVVKITKQDASTYLVTQQHFLFDSEANMTKSSYQSPFSYTWVIPFTFISQGNKDKQIHWMERNSTLIKDSSNSWIKGNPGYHGFYIVNYDNDNWNALKNQLISNHEVFSITDRAGLIFDAFMLASGSRLSYSTALDMTSYMRKESAFVPWKVLDQRLDYLKRILSVSSPAYKNLMKYLVYQAKDLYDKLGFQDTGSHLDFYKRSIVLDIYCMAGVSSCINNVSKQFNDWMDNPTKNRIPPNLRSVVYNYGVANGGAREWDFVYEQYKKADSPSDKSNLLYAMAASKEPWILARYLEYSLDPTKFDAAVIRNIIAWGVGDNPHGYRLAWDFVRLNWEKISKIFGSELRSYSLIPYIARRFASDFELNDLVKFNKAVAERTGSESSAMKQTREEVKANVKWLKTNEMTVEQWLAGFNAKHPI